MSGVAHPEQHTLKPIPKLTPTWLGVGRLLHSWNFICMALPPGGIPNPATQPTLGLEILGRANWFAMTGPPKCSTVWNLLLRMRSVAQSVAFIISTR